MKIKTIDVNAKEWFDKVNSNSYYSATISINYGMKSQKDFEIPITYGYGSCYLDSAVEVLIDRKMIMYKKGHIVVNKQPLWQYCENNNIILRYSKQENCLKRDLIQRSN